jgi:hypothetical protein
MATKALDKHQCLVRLDDTEIEKLAAIQSELGLSKTGAIRRLIRDFEIKQKKEMEKKNILADNQMSVDTFLSLPIQQITVIPDLINESDKLFIAKGEKFSPDIEIVGFAFYPSSIRPEYREFYQYDIIYIEGMLNMYRSIVSTGDPETGIPSKPKNYRKQISESKLVRKNLQQIFVV